MCFAMNDEKTVKLGIPPNELLISNMLKLLKQVYDRSAQIMSECSAQTQGYANLVEKYADLLVKHLNADPLNHISLLVISPMSWQVPKSEVISPNKLSTMADLTVEKAASNNDSLEFYLTEINKYLLSLEKELKAAKAVKDAANENKKDPYFNDNYFVNHHLENEALRAAKNLKVLINDVLPKMTFITRNNRLAEEMLAKGSVLQQRINEYNQYKTDYDKHFKPLSPHP